MSRWPPEAALPARAARPRPAGAGAPRRGGRYAGPQRPGRPAGAGAGSVSGKSNSLALFCAHGSLLILLTHGFAVTGSPGRAAAARAPRTRPAALVQRILTVSLPPALAASFFGLVLGEYVDEQHAPPRSAALPARAAAAASGPRGRAGSSASGFFGDLGDLAWALECTRAPYIGRARCARAQAERSLPAHYLLFFF